MKRSRLLAALLCGAVGAAALIPSAFAAAPNDMRHHWAQAQVYTLMEHGIITGYPDGTFRPDQPISRQEAVALLYGLLEDMDIPLDYLPPAEEEAPVENPPSQDIPYQVQQDQQESTDQDGSSSSEAESSEEIPPSHYTDLEGSFAQDQILCLEANGVLPQDDSGLFRPSDNLTRGEAAQLLYAVITNWPDSFTLTPVEQAPPIYDMTDRPDANAVYALAHLGVVSGRGDGGYHPDEAISRAEFSVLLLNLSDYPIITDVEFAPLPVATVIPTPYISQVYPYGAWVGCEPTSLLMGLKAKGYAQDVTLDQFLDAMPKSESDPAKGFVGSPYVPSETLRTTIYPAPLAQYGQRYGNVKDFSGKSVEELREEVLLGNPVVIYVTLYWQRPYYKNFNIEGSTQRLLRNNHAVLVCGYDSSTQYYYIADPYNIDDRYHDYFYWISADTLDPLYLERQHAVAIE